jgi:hypothetical protein
MPNYFQPRQYDVVLSQQVLVQKVSCNIAKETAQSFLTTMLYIYLSNCSYLYITHSIADICTFGFSL